MFLIVKAKYMEYDVSVKELLRAAAVGDMRKRCNWVVRALFNDDERLQLGLQFDRAFPDRKLITNAQGNAIVGQ